MPAIEFRNVSYRISGRTILDRISFTVERGETLVLLGRSGSGKTTALRMVNAMLYPSDGEVLVEGRATTAWDPIALRRQTGYVIQEGGLFPHLTIEQNVSLVPRLNNATADATRLLESVGLNRDFLSRFPRELSGGQRQRVGVARALAADPPVLLFDEPFGALDPVTRIEIQQEFLRIMSDAGKASIFVTHDIREAYRLATCVGLLSIGQLIYLGATEGLAASDHPEAKAFIASAQA
jgi:osmoprotectant transport system ATP-binding protein